MNDPTPAERGLPFAHTIPGLIGHWRQQAATCRTEAERLGENGPAYNELLRDAAQYEQTAHQLQTIAAHSLPSDWVAGAGLEEFTEYFVKNYPGPDTIIHDPKWHAPRIFGAAQFAIMKAAPSAQAEGGEDALCPNCLTPWKCNGPHLTAPEPLAQGAVAWVTPEALNHLAKQSGVAKVDAWNCASGSERVPLYASPQQAPNPPQPSASVGERARTVEVLQAIGSAFDGIPDPCEERAAIQSAIAALTTAADGGGE